MNDEIIFKPFKTNVFYRNILNIILGIVLKSHLRDWDWKAGIGDSLVSLIHSKVLS